MRIDVVPHEQGITMKLNHPKRTDRCSAVIAVAVLLVSAAIAQGADLYTLTGTATATGQTVTATGSNFLDLLQNASTASDQFQVLKGQDATYTLNYAGQTDVIKMTRNSSGTTATITIPSTGQSKTFTGATDNDVRKQIADYLRKNTDDAMGKLNK